MRARQLADQRAQTLRVQAERLDCRRVPSQVGMDAGQVDALEVEPAQGLAQRGSIGMPGL